METKAYTCKIVLDGPPRERWADYFGDFMVEVLVDHGRITCSTLTGYPADLGAFIGILESIHNLGLSVTAVEFASVPARNIDA